MKIIIKTMDTRGKTRNEMIEYFEGSMGIESYKTVDVNYTNENNSNSFSWIIIENNNVKIMIGEEGVVKLGQLTFPQVTVKVEGVELVVQETVDKFRLNFLSAGG